MSFDESAISRRGFLMAGAGLSSALMLGCGKSSSSAPLRPAPLLPQRTLGRTGLCVSMLGFGGALEFMRNEDGDWEQLLEQALDEGITLFDTSANYGHCEERYGTVLASRRQSIILSTKFDGRDRDSAAREFDRSLSRLKTDYVDILLIHSLDPYDDIPALERNLLPWMQDLKSQKIARFLGFSSMSSAQRSLEAVDRLDPDVIMIPLNPTNYGGFRQDVLPAAQAKGSGIIAMKTMMSLVGNGATPRELLSYVYSFEGVASAVVGHVGTEQLRQNVQIVKSAAAQSADSLQLVALEQRLAPLAGPHALRWAQEGYRDVVQL